MLKCLDMKPKNKYLKHAHISEHKFREILMYFCADETATKTSFYTKIGRTTVNRIFTLLRERILLLVQEEDKTVSGSIELDESYFGPRHIIYHSQNEFARGKNHVNGIESFWSYTKRRLSKFNGIKKERFPVFLKESQYRFNHRKDDVYAILLKELKKRAL